MTRRAGFTLVEILMVLAIIALITAITMPVFVRAKMSAKITTSISQLRQLYVITALYRSDHDGDGVYGDSGSMGLPQFPITEESLKSYPLTEELMTSPCSCHPDTNLGGPCGTNWNIHLVWAYESQWPGWATKFREGTPLFWDPHCNDRSTRLYNLYAMKRGNAVLLSGTAISRVGTGDLFNPSFYSTPQD
ncbi:MAG: prepilin-type N-terminal cleavage/methylation domain-containing protein [Fimbriimonadaceae bacterium]